MDIKQLRDLSDQDLAAEQARVEEKLFRIRFQKSLGDGQGVNSLRALRLDVARIKTIQRDRVISGQRS